MYSVLWKTNIAWFVPSLKMHVMLLTFVWGNIYFVLVMSSKHHIFRFKHPDSRGKNCRKRERVGKKWGDGTFYPITVDNASVSCNKPIKEYFFFGWKRSVLLIRKQFPLNVMMQESKSILSAKIFLKNFPITYIKYYPKVTFHITYILNHLQFIYFTAKVPFRSFFCFLVKPDYMDDIAADALDSCTDLARKFDKFIFYSKSRVNFMVILDSFIIGLLANNSVSLLHKAT